MIESRAILGYLVAVLATLLAAPVQAQDVGQCGTLRNHYGPYDYTNPLHVSERLEIVERVHFTSQVETLERGATSVYPMDDIDYVLRAFPNHHRALYAMAREYLKWKTPPASRGIYSADCYFRRAIAFRADDGMVRLVYGIYLAKSNRLDEALEQYQAAVRLMDHSSEAHYNLGLLYLRLGQTDKAVEEARRAYELGYPLPGLRDQLIERGVWKKSSAQAAP